MKKLNEKELIVQAIQRFRKNYGNGSYSADKRGRQIGAELGFSVNIETATAQQINEIIGVNWVVKPKCVECNHESWDNIEFTQELENDRGEYTVPTIVCANCLSKALAMSIQKESRYLVKVGDTYVFAINKSQHLPLMTFEKTKAAKLSLNDSLKAVKQLKNYGIKEEIERIQVPDEIKSTPVSEFYQN